MNKEKIKIFIKENRWIIAASIFFVVWKFFLIGVLWNDRLSPPEPDDSYTYIGYINSVKMCPKIICDYPSISLSSSTGFTYLTYRLFFGIISKITNLSPEIIFHFSFYFGIAFIIPILILFVKTLTENKNIVALSIFFLALYNGNGSYHGFFWVVPSFFALALFLLIFSIIQKNSTRWFFILFFIIPIFIYLHPISIYSIFIFPVYFLIDSAFERKIDKAALKKVIFVIVMAALSYFPMYLHFRNTGFKNSMGIENSAQKISESIQQTNEKHTSSSLRNTAILPGFEEIKNGYINWIFPNWIGVCIFSFFFSIILYYRQYRILALYLSSVLFIAISSLNEFGFRSLIFIWPITFILYAFGFWYSHRLITDKITNKKIKTALMFILFFSFSLFILINLIFSIFWNQNTSSSNNIKVNNNFTEYLYENTSERDDIYFSSKLLHSFSLTTNLIEKNIEVRNSPLTEKYYVIMKSTEYPAKKTNLEKFYDMLSALLNIERKKDSSEKQIDFKNENYILDKEFDQVLIYINKNY